MYSLLPAEEERTRLVLEKMDPKKGGKTYVQFSRVFLPFCYRISVLLPISQPWMNTLLCIET
jgi:hypothetical protein